MISLTQQLNRLAEGNIIKNNFRITFDRQQTIVSFTFRFRVDDSNLDRFSDADSLSFNSLSRSSSLIQFESLERQMQTADAQSFGGSTPSIHSQLNDIASMGQKSDTGKPLDTIGDCTTTSTSSGSPMRYYDIEKIDFDASMFLACREPSSCDSSSSTDNSIYYSDARESDADLKDCDNSLNADDTMLIRGSAANSSSGSNSSSNSSCIGGNNRRMMSTTVRCKSSVENLSEDSGFGDFPSMKIRSKSIPNLYNDQSLLEEDEDSGKCHETKRNKNKIHSRICFGDPKIEVNDDVATKTTKTVKNVKTTSTTSTFGSAKNSHATDSVRHKNITTTTTSMPSTTSTSLPDILNHISIFGDVDEFDRRSTNIFTDSELNFHSTSRASQSISLFDKQIVSSVPNDLNICSSDNEDIDCESDKSTTKTNWYDASESTASGWNFTNRNAINSCGWSSVASPTVASKNFDLAQAFSASPTNAFYLTLPTPKQSTRQQKIINSSHSNLTLLDYSDDKQRTISSFQTQLRTMAEHRQKRDSTVSNQSVPEEFGRCNFLLDEISAHFDRNLSILNDRSEDSELASDFVLETKEIPETKVKQPPKPPPRKIISHKKPDFPPPLPPVRPSNETPSTIDIVPTESTFDRDPTNLKTCYADSIERCNFEVSESSNSINLLERPTPNETTNFAPKKHSTPTKREQFASTPNLSQHDQTCEPFLQASGTYNSLTQLPQSSSSPEKTKSILSTAASKNSLGKGVSFYPFVSEISWLEQSSTEDAIDGDVESSNSDNESIVEETENR